MGSLFLLILIFQNVILKNVPSTSVLNYWDETLTLILLIFAVLAFLFGRVRKSRIDLQILICVVLIVIIGFFGSFLFQLSAGGFVAFKDMVGFVKFPLTFICVRAIGLDEYIAKSIDGRNFVIFKIMILIMFIFAIISLFTDVGMSQNELRMGIRPFQFLFSHPTYLVLASVMLLTLIDAEMQSNQVLKYEGMLLVIIVLSMRTKGFAIAAVYLIFKYGWQYLRKMSWILWILAIVAVYFVSITKINTYASYSGSPRESLYASAVELAKMYFPIGSGFGTFGSMLSGITGSKVYGFLTISGAWVNGQLTTVLGDAGYAYYLGEFGVLGAFLFLLMLYFIFKYAIEKENRLPGMIMLLYVLLALTAESTLLNAGVEVGVLVTVILKMEDFKALDEKDTVS